MKTLGQIIFRWFQIFEILPSLIISKLKILKHASQRCFSPETSCLLENNVKTTDKIPV